jgi:hypothetical protein
MPDHTLAQRLAAAGANRQTMAAVEKWHEWERGDDDLTLSGYQYADAAIEALVEELRLTSLDHFGKGHSRLSSLTTDLITLEQQVGPLPKTREYQSDASKTQLAGGEMYYPGKRAVDEFLAALAKVAGERDALKSIVEEMS